MGFLSGARDWITKKVGTIGSTIKKVAHVGGAIARKIGSFSGTAANLIQGTASVIGGVTGTPGINLGGRAISDVVRGIGNVANHIGTTLGDFSGVG